MKLMLSVISSNANLDRSSRITLNQENATIGRHEDNTLVLFDPKRYISSHHALIEYNPPDYFVTDISANGVIVNQSSKPLGKGNKIKLKDGDQINIGDYTLYVKLINDSAFSEALPIEPVKAQEPFDDPFAEFDSIQDPIKEAIKDNELFPSSQKREELPQDLFSIPGLDNDSSKYNVEHRHDNTAFNNVPAYKEAYQPLPKKLEEQKATTKPDKEASDFFPEDWFLDKENEADEIIPAKGFPPIEKPNPPIVKISPKPETPTQTADFNNELVQYFLRGADLEHTKFSEGINPQTFYTIGAMLRASVQGTRDVLDGRARIKNEMHLDVTLIKPRENNPIKFSVSTDEALIKLLTPVDKGYLSPEKAINEAFDDIRSHQYSVIAGMKSALLAILKRFDPKVLEERLQKQSPIGANIPIHKQAKLWGLFEDLYETLEKETQDNFYHLFGQAFAETYSQLMAKLKQDKSN